jgi:hypothetical protein
MVLSFIGRAGVRGIEAVLRRYYGVFEFTSDPQCIMRLSHSRSPRDLVLSDDTRIGKGDALLALHFRNERLAAVLRQDATLETGVVLVQGMRHSLRLLARYVQAQHELDAVRALYGDFGFVRDERGEQLQRMLSRLGFDLVAGERPGWDARRRAFWDNLYSWWMIWTFNPASLRRKSFAHMRRNEVWMSRAKLMAMSDLPDETRANRQALGSIGSLAVPR